MGLIIRIEICMPMVAETTARINEGVTVERETELARQLFMTLKMSKAEGRGARQAARHGEGNTEESEVDNEFHSPLWCFTAA